MSNPPLSSQPISFSNYPELMDKAPFPEHHHRSQADAYQTRVSQPDQLRCNPDKLLANLMADDFSPATQVQQLSLCQRQIHKIPIDHNNFINWNLMPQPFENPPLMHNTHFVHKAPYLPSEPAIDTPISNAISTIENNLEISNTTTYPTPVSKAGSTRRNRYRHRYLWKFIYQSLEVNSDIGVEWINRNQGSFKFTDIKKFSTKWCAFKHLEKKSLPYKSIARSLRTYYPQNILSKEPGGEYAYRFNLKTIDAFNFRDKDFT